MRSLRARSRFPSVRSRSSERTALSGRGFRGKVFCVVVVLVGLLVGGCGSGGGGFVARVGGRVVSSAALAHWFSVEAIISTDLNPQGPVPVGEVPDPPRYSACIAYMRASTASHEVSSGLQHRCRKRYEGVRRHMLTILITYAWLEAEAAVQGISVSEGEIRQQFKRYAKEIWPTEAAFHAYLKYTKQTLADEFLVSKMDLLSTKLQAKVIHGMGIKGATRFYHEFPRRWAARTSCSPGNVIPVCKQYRGPEPPEAAV
jgi:hypothetical protein